MISANAHGSVRMYALVRAHEELCLGAGSKIAAWESFFIFQNARLHINVFSLANQLAQLEFLSFY